jgi:hypothetical protein
MISMNAGTVHLSFYVPKELLDLHDDDTVKQQQAIFEAKQAITDAFQQANPGPPSSASPPPPSYSETNSNSRSVTSIHVVTLPLQKITG